MAGEAGVARVLEILRDEVDLALALCGCASPEEARAMGADLARGRAGRTGGDQSP